MTKISKDFTLEEFACRCGTNCKTHEKPLIRQELFKLVETILQPLRDDLGVPISINSGVRCDMHNRNIGGAPNSLHKKGKASDLMAAGMTPAQVHARILALAKAKKIKLGGRKQYETFNHVDTGPARTW